MATTTIIIPKIMDLNDIVDIFFILYQTFVLLSSAFYKSLLLLLNGKAQKNSKIYSLSM